jgi:hypothetical protein
MSFFIILLSGFTGTLSMTFFSYLLSSIYGNNFREPQLLNRLLAGSDIISLDIDKSSSIGWFLHYCFGWFFATLYYIMVRFFEVSPGWLAGLLFGMAAGLISIAGWKIMFMLNSNPPEVHQSKFFIHILLAHIIFGWGVTMVYYLI